MGLRFAVLIILIAMGGARLATAEDVKQPSFSPQTFAHAAADDAKQCSKAALTSYALSSPDPAEKVAEAAFFKCIEKWKRFAEIAGHVMETSQEHTQALEKCVKVAGSSCRLRQSPSAMMLEAAQRTFQHDAMIMVFDIRAKAAGK